LCVILLNTFWGVIFFTSLDQGGIHRYIGPGVVIVAHMLFSCLVSERVVSTIVSSHTFVRV
jgi:hypothetical protein